MTTPEPLDEQPGGGVEIRGGNSPADWTQPMPFIEEDLRRERESCGPDCDCDEDE
jgi:hypothetical protein